MNARDVMTTRVVAVSPDTPINKIAELLLENGISAVPVVDRSGAPIGIVSEGDLIGREEAVCETRRDWWLGLLAGEADLNADYLASLRGPERTANEVMTAPVVTVSEESDISEIARLLTVHRIKRVPVVRDGRVIGIVSRADLLRGLAQGELKPEAPEASTTGHRKFDWLDKQFLHAHRSESGHPTAQPVAAGSEDAFGVDEIRRQWFDAVQTFAAWSANSSAAQRTTTNGPRRAAAQ